MSVIVKLYFKNEYTATNSQENNMFRQANNDKTKTYQEKENIVYIFIPN